MGFKERKERAKAFQQKTAKAVGELRLPGLFDGGAVDKSLTFECIRDPADTDMELTAGESVRLIDMRNRVEVYKSFYSIGYVIAAEEFRNSVSLSDANGMAVDGLIIEVSTLGSTFVVRVQR